MKSIIAVTILLAMVCIYWGCSKVAMRPEENAVCMPQFPDKSVTYDNYVENVLHTYCVSCHNGSGIAPGDFRTYNGVRQYTSEFQIRVIQSRADMPQGNAPLPKNIRDSLAVWIGNCTPEK